MRYLLFALSASVLSACVSSKSARESAPQISWHCKFDPEQSRGGPASIIVDGQSFPLMSHGTSGCRTLPRSEYLAHDVPDDAISAAAGWFAGGGEEFYASLESETLVVYHRLVEETGPERPRYRKIGRIPFPPPPNHTKQRTPNAVGVR